MSVLPASSLSIVGRTLRSHLTGTGVPEDQILVGHPNLSVKSVDEGSGKQHLNLFFYRIEYGAHPADAASDEPLFVRLYCLITALGVDETVDTEKISAGENDLRLIGGVMQRLQERPVLRLRGAANQEIAQLQVVPHSLSLDDINHIWATQGDTPYRLSAGYELALIPLPAKRKSDRVQRVGAIGIEVQPDMSFRPLPAEGFSIASSPPQVPAVSIDTDRPDWVPHICWRDGDSLQYSLSLATADLLPDEGLMVIVLGKPGAEVQLEWERWQPGSDPESVDTSWQIEVPAQPPTIVLEDNSLDPRGPLPGAKKIALPLQARGQAVLYAKRNFVRPDKTSVVLRSNPLLVSVHNEARA